MLNLPSQSCLRGRASLLGGSRGLLPLAATLETQWSPCGSTVVRGGLLWEERRDSPDEPRTPQPVMNLRGYDEDLNFLPSEGDQVGRCGQSSESLTIEDSLVNQPEGPHFPEHVQREHWQG